MRKLIINADVITMEETNNITAILVEDGKIKAIGRDSEILELKKSGDEVIDMEGKCVMPAFIDPHSHITALASTLMLADLSPAKNFSGIIDILNKYKEENKDAEAIIGFNYDNNFLEEKMHPDKFILDKVSKDIPIAITHKSGHMGVVNSKALEVLNITKDTEDMQGGVIGRIPGTTEPNGYLEELAFISNVHRFSKPSIETSVANIVKAQKIYASYGIATCQDGKTTKLDFIPLEEAAKRQKLELDVISYVDMKESKEDLKDEIKAYKEYNNRLRIGGYKLFLDGSPQGRTAWMLEPYAGEKEYRGYPIYEDAKLKEYLNTAIDENMQILAHCNGDAASEQYLRCFEEINRDLKQIRPVMIHAQLTTREQIARMKNIDMMPSFFNTHIYHYGDVHTENFGLDRARNISNAKAAVDYKVPFTFHHDTPVVMPDVILAIYTAVNRKTISGKTLGEENKISVYDALKAVTINCAYQYFEEDIKGSIKEGKLADFVVLSENPLKIQKENIRDIKVLETYKEGNLIYKNNHV